MSDEDLRYEDVTKELVMKQLFDRGRARVLVEDSE